MFDIRIECNNIEGHKRKRGLYTTPVYIDVANQSGRVLQNSGEGGGDGFQQGVQQQGRASCNPVDSTDNGTTREGSLVDLDDDFERWEGSSCVEVLVEVFLHLSCWEEISEFVCKEFFFKEVRFHVEDFAGAELLIGGRVREMLHSKVVVVKSVEGGESEVFVSRAEDNRVDFLEFLDEGERGVWSRFDRVFRKQVVNVFGERRVSSLEVFGGFRIEGRGRDFEQRGVSGIVVTIKVDKRVVRGKRREVLSEIDGPEEWRNGSTNNGIRDVSGSWDEFQTFAEEFGDIG
jgi:hypothetical protein